ncbi:hypothetical protein [Gluconobacter thailandicus]|uniref:Uncharacterized protein n=1 Tax=Gluconobacter thailandicus TaxID=257438 RepID=A0AAP9JIZ9_GLUTH|nr:hypothetical protein [Gluconobacter thailandicus]QEH97848.1 hypothetical protein FXF46_16290 [Gluconobacter thailandicus]
MNPAPRKSSFDFSEALKNRVKNRVDRLKKAIDKVRDELYPQLECPSHSWYRKVIARSAGFPSLHALEEAVKRGEQTLISRLSEDDPSYQERLSIALSDNFGVAVTSGILSRLPPCMQGERDPDVLPAVIVRGHPWGFLGPRMSLAEHDDLTRSLNGGSLPEFSPEFEKRSKYFFRKLYGGKGQETDLKGGFRDRLFNEKSPKTNK